jgi:hybrid cluster-associated redox disulfide protein
MAITKDMRIGELLTLENANIIAAALMNSGMHCLGCPASQMESLEEACMVHDINCDALVSQLNEILDGQPVQQ